ncbi:MAG: hypothetical protein PHQ12_11995 [Chthoniobacteraceae bacterium]|nr:hypothetical protein [Chthoniobacteraceae bacterium]
MIAPFRGWSLDDSGRYQSGDWERERRFSGGAFCYARTDVCKIKMGGRQNAFLPFSIIALRKNYFFAAFLAGAFFATTFLAAAFLAGAFFATTFFTAAFLAGAFFATAFFATAFFAGAFFAAAFFTGAFVAILRFPPFIPQQRLELN